MKRRELLGLGAGAALVGASGCVGAVANATTRTGAGPAVAYAPGPGGQVPATFDFSPPAVETTGITKATLTVQGSVGGLSGSVDVDGWFTSSLLRAKNFDSTRSNDRDVKSAGDGGDTDGDGWSLAAATAYLDGEAVIGERFVLSLPNAKPPGSSEPMAEFAPDQLLDAVTAGDEAGGGGSSSGAVRFKPGSEFTDEVRLTAVGTPVRNVRVSGGYDKASPKIYEALGTGGDGGATGLPDQWPTASSFEGGSVSRTIVGSALVSVADGGGSVAFPGLVYMKRIRHGEDFLFVGGWVLDAGHLYSDAATLLVEEAPNEVVGLSADEVGSVDDATIGGRLTRERSRLGSLVYDGPATEGVLPFLPAALREGDGLGRFATASKRSARKGRNPQTGKEIKIPAKRVTTMGNTVAVIQARVDRCGLDSCATVGKHAGARKSHIERAQSALDDGDTAAAREELLEVRGIVAGDIELLAGVDDRQAVGDLLGLERALRRETDLALDPLDRDVDGDGFSESDGGDGDVDVEEIELAVEKIERGIAGDDDGDGIWDPIDESAVAGDVSSDRLLVADGVVGTAHTFELKEGRKGMNAVNVQRTRTAGGDGDDPSLVRYWSVFGSGGDHQVVVTVVADAEGRAMNKAELIDAIASEADITKADARRSLDAFIDTTTKLHAGIEKDQVKRGMVVAKPELSGGGSGGDPVVPLVDGPVGDAGTVLKTTVVPLDCPLVHLTSSTKSLKKGDRVALVGFGSFSTD